MILSMFESLMNEIKRCRFCQENFGFEPTPILWGKENSKIVQISQAPSKNVHDTKKPFNDQSGKTLIHKWYQISEEEFYNTDNFYIGALAHCYPGKDKNGGDRKPPKCCYNKWVEKEMQILDNQIYIIIGALSAKIFFPNEKFVDLVLKNNYLHGKLAIVLPHPSPLNRRFLKAHPDFENKRLPEIRAKIKEIINTD